MYKGFKVRLFPTKEQEELMWKHIGCSRFIWNYMLALQEERYKNGEKHLSRFDMIKLLTPLKKQCEYNWLNEISTVTLQITCTDLSEAYQRMFIKTAKHPKFKSKHKSKPSFPICAERFYFNKDTVQIQKLGKVKYKSEYKVSIPIGNHAAKFINPRILYTGNKWILSFGMECENQALDLEGRMGIDLGIKELAVVSFNGEPTMVHNINKSKRVRNLNRKLKHLQRNLSRKKGSKKGETKSKRFEKNVQQIKEVYRKITNIRNNHIHQTTHRLVEMKPEVVTMEDLNVTGMMKNKHLSRAVGEQCFHEFKRQMIYKCESRGIKLQLADRFYPSSKTCSCCGFIKKDLKLSERVYKCPECGSVIDRDFNAALNLERYVVH